MESFVSYKKKVGRRLGGPVPQPSPLLLFRGRCVQVDQTQLTDPEPAPFLTFAQSMPGTWRAQLKWAANLGQSGVCTGGLC